MDYWLLVGVIGFVVGAGIYSCSARSPATSPEPTTVGRQIAGWLTCFLISSLFWTFVATGVSIVLSIILLALAFLGVPWAFTPYVLGIGLLLVFGIGVLRRFLMSGWF